MAVKIIKDVNNNTIDISENNLITFKQIVQNNIVAPIALKVTPLSYDSNNSKLTISGTANFSGTLQVGGENVITKFVPQVRTIADFPLTSNISTESLSAKLGVNFIITDEILDDDEE